MFASPCCSRAIAAQTHESIPPLRSTTAFEVCELAPILPHYIATNKTTFFFDTHARRDSPCFRRLLFRLPLSPGPKQTCAAAILAAPANHPQGSTPPTYAAPARSTSPPGHRTPVKTKPASRVPPADAAP